MYIRILNTLGLVAAVLLILSACTSQVPTTSEGIKAWVQEPFPMLGLMLIASLFSAFKQMNVARRAGTNITCQSYFLDHWPETMIMLGSNAGLWLTLIMTDSLDWKAALGLGYIANDAADLFTRDGRSTAVGGSMVTPPKQ